MADVKKIGEDVSASLLPAVKVMGPLDSQYLTKISTLNNNIQSSLHYYDRKASDLSKSIPTKSDRKEDLNNFIKNRYQTGKGYTDKRYKMMFMRLVYKIPHVLKGRDGEKQKVISASLEALTIFKLLYNLIVTRTNALVGQGHGGSGSSTLDPEEFDEQSSVTNELESTLKPTRATDKHQKQTQISLDRKTKGFTPTSKSSDEAEYGSAITKYNHIIENAKTSIRAHSSAIEKSLSLADAPTFSLIARSSKAANDLARSYADAASWSRDQNIPGSYTACKAFADLILELHSIVLKSVAPNKKQQKFLRKRQEGYDKYMSTTEVEEPNPEG